MANSQSTKKHNRPVVEEDKQMKDQEISVVATARERNEEVRDALLRQFHRWPETKISRAVEQCQKLSQEAENLCQYQVEVYIEELRGKLLAGAKALFWLNVLQPVLHPALIPRQEAQEVLLLLLEELKSVDGVYEQFMKKSEHTWDVLTLPLTLEPLFRRVSTLALGGHEIAENEARQILAMFAEQNAVFSRLKKATSADLSIVPSVCPLAALEISTSKILPKPFCEQFSRLFFMQTHDWFVVVDEVLDILGRSLASRWASCERASFEETCKNTVEQDLQSNFARLRHALATDQLYGMREAGTVRLNADDECLDVSILHKQPWAVACAAELW
ncbi:unnamed protein product [Peronospora destructor]|uniref:Uncharacterized protein n=1 Tax=Peronospora destructor TaxID=86335 RepID=A0AAV0U5Q4_9STRA|nr:unnamed protein product [Peronospora destructor]